MKIVLLKTVFDAFEGKNHLHIVHLYIIHRKK